MMMKKVNNLDHVLIYQEVVMFNGVIRKMK